MSDAIARRPKVKRDSLHTFGLRCFLSAFAFFRSVLPALAAVYLTKEEALKTAFPDSARTVEEIHRLEERAPVTFFVGKTGEAIDGYAVILDEIGKHEFITFLVVISPAGDVRSVYVMSFREPIGDEVRHKPFLKQFRGKTLEDPIQIQKDIDGITGATLSVRAATRAVRRALELWGTLYGRTP